ncbi:MAG: hypothetical protein ACOC2U_00550 [bacterium]
MMEFLQFLVGILSDDAMINIVTWIIRIFVLTLFGIGIRYTIINMFPKIKEYILTIIITISILSGSSVIQFAYQPADIMLKNIWELLVFWLISNGLYQITGKDICKRLDHWLDRKFGEN